MKNLIQKAVFAVITAAALILCIDLIDPIKAEAAGGYSVYLDIDGNFVFHTSDKIRTSSIWYKTVGITISKAVFPPEQIINPDHQYVYCITDGEWGAEFSDTGSFENGTFTIPQSVLMSKIAAQDGEWYEQLATALDGTGPGIWLRFDCIMCVFHDKTLKTTGGNAGGGTLYVNMGDLDGQNPALIQASESWADPRGLETHFNNWFYIGRGEPAPPEEIPDIPLPPDEKPPLIPGRPPTEGPPGNEEPVSSPKGNPVAGGDETNALYNTGHAATASPIHQQFSPKDGIPSSEYLQNYTSTQNWYGSTKVYGRIVNKNYRPKYTYEYTYKANVTVYVDSEGNESEAWGGTAEELEKAKTNGTVTEKTVTKEFRGSIIYVFGSSTVAGVQTCLDAYVGFVYLADVDIKEFASVSIVNNSYGGQGYTNKDPVHAECVSSKAYVDVAQYPEGTNVTSWLADTDQHVTWAEVPDRRFIL